MRRLYLIVPGASLAERVVGELRADGQLETTMRLFARQPSRLAGVGLPVVGLHRRRDRCCCGARPDLSSA